MSQSYCMMARNAAAEMYIKTSPALMVTRRGKSVVVCFADRFFGAQETRYSWVSGADDSENLGMATLQFLQEHAPYYKALHCHRINSKKYLVVLD